MSRTSNDIPPRLIDLMVERATQGLSPQGEAELSAAMASDNAVRIEADAYELAATAVELTLAPTPSIEALPAALRDKIIASASWHVTKPAATAPFKLTESTRAQADKPAFSLADGRMFGWYAAIAALLALCLVLLGPNTQTSNTTAPSYSELLTEPDTITATWGFNADGGDERFANATGEVIWNSDQQTGYMKLAGLPINDPTKEQYQLWIVDPARDAEPIDGGVFNITAQGEVIIPIDAKLRAESPAVFAITIEQPGGVVVSQGPLQVVAAVQKS